MFKKNNFYNLIFLVILASAFSLAHAAENISAKEIYQNNCAACHGSIGKPDPDNPMFNELGLLPANFTDPLFSSREPSKDWFLVVKEGGAAKGFSKIMPAFKEILSDLQIKKVISYIKTLAGDHGYPSGDMNFVLPIRTKKAFPEDEVVWKLRFQDNINNKNRNQVRNVLEIEKRIFKNTQLSLELSHSIDDGIDNGHGNFDQIEPGIKQVIYENVSQQFIASVGTLLAIKTEERAASDEVIPYIAVAKRLTKTLTMQGTARSTLPLDKFSEGNVELSSVVHWSPSLWPRSFKPGLELVASFPIDRGAGSSRKSFAQLSLIPQTQIGLNKRGHIMLNLGAEIPLNDTERYDYRGYAYLIWDFADGGLFDGW
ncbi:MAG: cytochrome c [Proteobacteria bacterium]|nr:cytochrome c [Pseudomonadota bacterium]NOG61091.1 cytochrome c [Pseudomonadota bacterium]